jgi:hypothetical protein
VVLAVIRAAIVKLHLGGTHEERSSEKELGMNRRQGSFVAMLGVALMAGEAVQAADVVRVGEGPFITGGGYFIARERVISGSLASKFKPWSSRMAHCPWRAI